MKVTAALGFAGSSDELLEKALAADLDGNGEIGTYISTSSTTHVDSSTWLGLRECVVDLDFLEFVTVMTDNCSGGGTTTVSSMINKFKTTFHLFDTSGSGLVGTEELGTVLRSLGLNPSDYELQQMCRNGSVEETSAEPSQAIKDLLVSREAVEVEEQQLLARHGSMLAQDLELAQKVLEGHKRDVDVCETLVRINYAKGLWMLYALMLGLA